MNPPLRLESDRRAVIEGLRMVLSQLSPRPSRLTMQMKNVEDITKAPSGMTGLGKPLYLSV